MERTLSQEAIDKVGQSVELAGWVNSRRAHGKVTFIDLRDRAGLVQIVFVGDLAREAAALNSEDVVQVAGVVQKRSEGTVNPDLPTGTIEVKANKLTILEKAGELPFDTGRPTLEVALPTLLDYRPLTLRHPKIQAIFKIQEAVVDAFRQTLQGMGFTEFSAPTIVPTATEGGSEIFHLDYYAYDAYFGQSPQLYKQIMVGVFERVFSVARAYRAEPSVTTRHLSEYVSLDAELGFIKDFGEIMDVVEVVIRGIFARLEKSCQKELALYGATLPKVPAKFPHIKMREAQAIIFERTGRDKRSEPDLEPEDEREICRYALEKYDSDLIFITHYPTKKRPFYTFPDPADPEYTRSFDLLGRGLEWVTGGQRINNYDQLVANIKKWGNKPEDFELYLQAFKYGMPPEGGFAVGAERVTMQVLGLENVREASLFPRDMERVDRRLAELQPNKKSSTAGAGEEVFSKIRKLLDEKKIKYEVLEHEPVYTSEQAAKVRGVSSEMGAKALIFKADKKPMMLVVPGNKKVDTAAFKKAFGISDLALMTAEEVKKLAGIEIGAVPPFGNIFNLPTYFDESFKSHTLAAFNAGLHTRSLKMKAADLVTATEPTFGSFAI